MSIVDVVVPAHGALRALKRCVESVHASRNACAYELVVVDDGNADPELVQYLHELRAHRRVTVVALSQAALNSKWVEWEIRKHLELHPDGDRILPLKFEPLSPPPYLEGQFRIDFTDPTKDAENAATVARHIRTADAEAVDAVLGTGTP